MIYTLTEKVQMVKWNYGGNSIQGTINLFAEAFENRPIPANTTIRRIITNLETNGCLSPTMHKKTIRAEGIEGDEQICAQFNMVYTLAEKLQIIKWNYGGRSIRGTRNLFKDSFKSRPVPSACTILRIINNLETKGCLTPTMHMKSPRIKVPDEAVIRRDEVICACAEENPLQSNREIAEQVGVAQMTVSRVLRRYGYHMADNIKKKTTEPSSALISNGCNPDGNSNMTDNALNQIKRDQCDDYELNSDEDEDGIKKDNSWLSSSSFEFINCEEPTDEKSRMMLD